jgi:GAF domain-containing protein
VRSVTQATGFKACSLRLLAADGNHLQQAAAYGLSEAYTAKGPVRLEQSPIDRMVVAGQVVQISDVANDWRWQYPEEAAQEGICSVLNVPLRTKTRIIGVLRTYTDKPHHFDDEEVQFVMALASLGALAIENARCYEQMHLDYRNTLEGVLGFTTSAAGVPGKP